ncbi:hypothetical protein KM043_012271 [Ampulex compressa]|nr:hypothetical protein KM043_012271 [Ampulex compressa]
MPPAETYLLDLCPGILLPPTPGSRHSSGPRGGSREARPGRSSDTGSDGRVGIKHRSERGLGVPWRGPMGSMLEKLDRAAWPAPREAYRLGTPVLAQASPIRGMPGARASRGTSESASSVPPGAGTACLAYLLPYSDSTNESPSILVGTLTGCISKDRIQTKADSTSRHR